MESELVKLLASQGDIELAILFGSHAAGTARPDSDIDIAIRATDILSGRRKQQLISSIADLFGVPVDLVDLRVVGEPLLGEILKGRKLVGSSRLYAQYVSRHLFDAADFVPLQRRMLKERRERWIQ